MTKKLKTALYIIQDKGNCIVNPAVTCANCPVRDASNCGTCATKVAAAMEYVRENCTEEITADVFETLL